MDEAMISPSDGIAPIWYDNKRINEVLFCECFFAEAPHEMCARQGVHRGRLD